MSDSTEDPERLAEEDPAYVRQAKFGRLPARVHPADVVESEDAGPVHDEPDVPMVRREWG